MTTADTIHTRDLIFELERSLYFNVGITMFTEMNDHARGTETVIHHYRAFEETTWPPAPAPAPAAEKSDGLPVI